MKLSTKAVVTSDAIKFVTRQKKQQNMIEEIKMLGKRVDAIEEEMTTEGVF